VAIGGAEFVISGAMRLVIFHNQPVAFQKQPAACAAAFAFPFTAGNAVLYIIHSEEAEIEPSELAEEKSGAYPGVIKGMMHPGKKGLCPLLFCIKECRDPFPGAQKKIFT
jgi:hypothetical protein